MGSAMFLGTKILKWQQWECRLLQLRLNIWVCPFNVSNVITHAGVVSLRPEVTALQRHFLVIHQYKSSCYSTVCSHTVLYGSLGIYFFSVASDLISILGYVHTLRRRCGLYAATWMRSNFDIWNHTLFFLVNPQQNVHEFYANFAANSSLISPRLHWLLVRILFCRSAAENLQWIHPLWTYPQRHNLCFWEGEPSCFHKVNSPRLNLISM